MEPRLVVVTRPTEYAGLLAAHATHGQAAWYLSNHGQKIEEYVSRHERQTAALAAVSGAIPPTWRRAFIDRADLDRFLFEPEDVVLVIGQDGLVPNVARYAGDQPVIGVNPDPSRYDGVLVRHPPVAVPDLLREMSRWRFESRTMIEARTSDGQTMTALNEIFVGHRSHQSARYAIRCGGRSEQQSSSGVVIATGTGSTGWARSIHQARRSPIALPTPTQPDLVFFVREAWPSVTTATTLVEGTLTTDQALEITSQMTSGGVVFGDGMEGDVIDLPWARTVVVRRSPRSLRLVT